MKKTHTISLLIFVVSLLALGQTTEASVIIKDASVPPGLYFGDVAEVTVALVNTADRPSTPTLVTVKLGYEPTKSSFGGYTNLAEKIAEASPVCQISGVQIPPNGVSTYSCKGPVPQLNWGRLWFYVSLIGTDVGDENGFMIPNYLTGDRPTPTPIPTPVPQLTPEEASIIHFGLIAIVGVVVAATIYVSAGEIGKWLAFRKRIRFGRRDMRMLKKANRQDERRRKKAERESLKLRKAREKGKAAAARAVRMEQVQKEQQENLRKKATRNAQKVEETIWKEIQTEESK